MKVKATIFCMLCVSFLTNCQESQGLNETEQKRKITFENIGEVHNDLLASYQSKSKTRGLETASTKSKKMSTYFDEFKDELYNSTKYDIDEKEKIKVQNSINSFQDVSNLKIDENFYNNALKLTLKRIINNDEISNEVKEALIKITDLNNNITDNEISSLVEKYKDYKGGEYLVVSKKIYKSSSVYWHPATKSSASRATIIADVVGGVLGATCGGVMSVIWGGAFSYAMDMSVDP